MATFAILKQRITMKRKIWTALLLCVIPAVMWSNDGVVYVNGNQLVPINETEISIAKEVLTISIRDDGYADVDVLYELTNHGKEKTVSMGFEAEAPYNVEAPFNKEGQHPFIHDFTVTMNGERLSYKNAIIGVDYQKEQDFAPLDLKQWQQATDIAEHLVRDAATDSVMPFAYAYYFTAKFKEGRNEVHHTYRYRISYGVWRAFEIPYWLKPAMRWANHKIDDFTLRIKAENTAKHFCLNDSLFAAAPFKIADGKGKMRKVKNDSGESVMEVALRDATLEWHAKDFVPSDNLTILAGDGKNHLGAFYDRGEHYQLWGLEEQKLNHRIMRNLPYAHRGYVFRDKKLKAYFEKLWWYMPDPTWQAATDDFTPRELKWIEQYK